MPGEPVPGEPVPGRGGSLHSLDDLLLVRLVGKNLETFPDRVFFADERLVFVNDLTHGRFDAGEVVVSEMGTPGKLEVVIKTVFDRRPDGVLRPWPEPGHGLGHHVCRGVPKDFSTRARCCRYDADAGAVS